MAVEAGLALGIHAEDHRGDPALAVVGGGLRHGRQHPVETGRVPEIGRHGGLELVVAVVAMAVARLFGMGVEVDGDDVVEVHGHHSSGADNFAVRFSRKSRSRWVASGVAEVSADISDSVNSPSSDDMSRIRGRALRIA